MNLTRISTCILVLLLIAPSIVQAQVSGVVRNAAGLAPIEGAIVSLQATGTRTTTAADGTFSFPGLTGTGLVIVAAVPGSFHAWTTVDAPASGIELLVSSVPLDDDASYSFVPPEDCGGCHPDQYDQWLGSPMADAGINTWVYDIYDGTGTPGGFGGFVYQRDSVFADSNPHSECASCHQPEPWIVEPHVGLGPLSNITPGMAHGISCDTCHKLADVDATQINFPGIYPGVTTFIRPAPGSQVQFGLLGDSNFDLAGQMQPAFNPQLAAEVCGACHQDKNDPDEDGDFEEPNGVISEPTYLEWKNSPYGDINSGQYQSCLECHMLPSGADQACSVLVPPLLRDPTTLRSHDIRGTTPEFLENAVTMTLTTETVGNELIATVSIENDQTGHMVPTGVTIRNMILVVEAVRTEDGAELAHVGAEVIHPLGGVGNPDHGYYAGLPGRLYGKVNHAANGQGPTFFTDATGIIFDNRILPLATDTTQYPFLLPTTGGTLEVHARLIYRRSWRALTDAKGWTEDGHGNPLADVQAPHYGHLMEESTEVEAFPFTTPTFLRGDTNSDSTVDIADAVSALEYLFIGGATPGCLDAADANDDGILDLADPIRVLMYITGGQPPALPGPTVCGADPSAGVSLSCGYSGCP